MKYPAKQESILTFLATRMAAAALLMTATSSLFAQTNVSPNLATTVPGAFYTDRYTPTVFQLMNGVHGRNDVLQLVAGTDAANRPAGLQAPFYNTQGMKTDVNTAGSWLFESDLFVESAWANARAGYVRTDIWATATNDVAFSSVSAYPIVGFTNYGGAARFRGYDVNTDLWIDFGAPVLFNTWNKLAMGFDLGTNTFSYFVNGSLAGSVVGLTPTTGVANVMYQAYNFNDPVLAQVSGNPDVTVNWSNTSSVVPEPSTYALMAFGLAGVFGMRRKRQAPTA
ncbi:MAG: PEP-CTERM sorting domain-containing protein [Gemmatimonadaceae bacterium]